MPNADKFQLHIYAALAEQEREFISQRTKAGLQRAKERSVKLGGVRPGIEKANVALFIAWSPRPDLARKI
ncbi:recombinase family protein [Synechococcus sp. MU1655]|uniref:recombinase family protein n=1 Tax=unclassified Synechococcus TaxID=2626047 RepID=UPI0020273309|nr:recombinase family protein [Synechococcus sp. MU1655]